MRYAHESKWDWLARKCNERGYCKAADIAVDISYMLNTIYGVEDTDEWMNEYVELETSSHDISDLVLLGVANNPAFCIGCKKDHRREIGCKGCAFGVAAGICTEEDSIFGDFITTLEEVAFIEYEG